MPIPVTKYRCQFKCGTSAKSSIKLAERHEKTCFSNPERRACTTCKYEVYYKDSCEHPELDGCETETWMVRSCKTLSNEAFELLEKRNELTKKPMFYINPIVNCPYWDKK